MPKHEQYEQYIPESQNSGKPLVIGSKENESTTADSSTNAGKIACNLEPNTPEELAVQITEYPNLWGAYSIADAVHRLINQANYIKAHCPKAFDLCIKRFSDKDYGRNYGFAMNYPWSDRKLYDFFDENGIDINIHTDYTRQGYGSLLYAYTFDGGQTYSDLFRQRVEAETAVFTDAFFKLEERLKGSL